MGDKTFASFFSELSSKLSNTNQLELLTSAFRKCGTDAERIAFILKTDAVASLFKSRTYRRPKLKSDSLSESFREEGNRFFKQKDFNHALQSYTNSVFNSPCKGDSTVSVSLALANRSAVLFHMQDYKACLTDAKEALCQGYPQKLKYKLLDRMGRCHLKLGNCDLAKESFELALSSLNSSELCTSRKNEIAMQILKLKKTSENECFKKTDLSKRDTINSVTPEIDKHDINPVYPCAKASFDIQFDSDVGRSAIATRDIEAGEIILVEKPFASVLMPERRLTHCHNCLIKCNNLIGCTQCSSVGFCCQQCRITAWQGFHSVECEFLDVLQESKIDFGNLSLRMVIKAGLRNLVDFNEKYQNVNISDPKYLGVNSKGVYDSLDYGAVHSLIGHSEDRSLSDLFRRTVVAVFLLKFIENEPFFSEEPSNFSTEEKKVCIGSHILKQLQMLPCNAHEVSELHINKSNVATSELKEIGSAIYATLSLLNHSCDPSVVRHSYKDSCALRAIKFIPKGGEIIDNYGALYAVTPYNERQEQLSSQYYFKCTCKACTNQWPLYSDLKDVSPVFKCSNCSKNLKLAADSIFTQCSYCNLELSINTVMFESNREKFQRGMASVLDGGDPAKHLPSLLNHMQLISKYVQLPWQEFNNCQEIVKQCFSMLANHCYI